MLKQAACDACFAQLSLEIHAFRDMWTTKRPKEIVWLELSGMQGISYRNEFLPAEVILDHMNKGARAAKPRTNNLIHKAPVATRQKLNLIRSISCLKTDMNRLIVQVKLGVNENLQPHKASRIIPLKFSIDRYQTCVCLLQKSR